MVAAVERARSKDFIRIDLERHLSDLERKDRIYRLAEWLPRFSIFGRVRSVLNRFISNRLGRQASHDGQLTRTAVRAAVAGDAEQFLHGAGTRFLNGEIALKHFCCGR